MERTENTKNKSLSRSIKCSSRIFQIAQFRWSFKCHCQISVSGSHRLFYYYYCCLWRKSIHNRCLFKDMQQDVNVSFHLCRVLVSLQYHLGLRNRHCINNKEKHGRKSVIGWDSRMRLPPFLLSCAYHWCISVREVSQKPSRTRNHSCN